MDIYLQGTACQDGGGSKLIIGVHGMICMDLGIIMFVVLVDKFGSVNKLFKFCKIELNGTFASCDMWFGYWSKPSDYTPVGAFEQVERKIQGSQYKCSFLSNRCLTEGLNTSGGQEEWLVRGEDA